MAFWMISGTGTPDGNDRPRPVTHTVSKSCLLSCQNKHRPENMRIVRRPWRRLFSEASGGLGVTARDGIGVTERDTTPFSLLSLDSAQTGQHRSQTDTARRTLRAQLPGGHGGGER